MNAGLHTTEALKLPGNECAGLLRGPRCFWVFRFGRKAERPLE
jgi:hypothetical protein